MYTHSHEFVDNFSSEAAAHVYFIVVDWAVSLMAILSGVSSESIILD